MQLERNLTPRILVSSGVRFLAIFVTCAIAGSTFADSRADFLSALSEAKKAGLPVSRADLKVSPPSRQTLALEALIDKAGKAMRKYEPSLGDQVSWDLENVKRKRHGKPELPYPEVTAAQKAKRTKETLAIIEQIGATTDPRRYNSNSTPLDSFPRSASVKAFVNMELDEAASSAKKGDAKQVVKRLKIVRRLIDIVRSDSTMVGVLAQQASEQKYYAALQKLSHDYPAIGKSFTRELVAPFKRPTTEQILKEEFIHSLMIMAVSGKSAKQLSTIEAGGYKFPSDKDSLGYLAAWMRSWAISYSELKTARPGQELEDRYKTVAPKIGTYKIKGEDDMVLGPGWAESAKALDRAEAKRQETIKVLGLG